jgi:DNA-binding NtrC family response regulator
MGGEKIVNIETRIIASSTKDLIASNRRKSI